MNASGPYGEAARVTMPSPLHAAAVRKVVHLMRDRLGDAGHLTLQAMAAASGYSCSRLTHVFRSVTGISPIAFLTALRVESAKRLLLTTRSSVTRVCLDVGFLSLGTFTRRFTGLVGVSPSHFRSAGDRLAATSLGVGQLRDLAVYYGHGSQDETPTGTVMGADDAQWIVIVGLFPKPIPQGRPASCTLLAGPGPFRLGRVQDGRYYVLAASIPLDADMLACLLPDHDRAWVGVGPTPIVVSGGVASSVPVIQLRRARPVDPPILTAFPILIAESLAMRAAPAAM